MCNGVALIQHRTEVAAVATLAVWPIWDSRIWGSTSNNRTCQEYAVLINFDEKITVM